MSARLEKEKKNRMKNKHNLTMVKNFIKEAKKNGFTSDLESKITSIGKKVFHKNKVSRIISRLSLYNKR